MSTETWTNTKQSRGLCNCSCAMLAPLKRDTDIDMGYLCSRSIVQNWGHLRMAFGDWPPRRWRGACPLPTFSKALPWCPRAVVFVIVMGLARLSSGDHSMSSEEGTVPRLNASEGGSSMRSSNVLEGVKEFTRKSRVSEDNFSSSVDSTVRNNSVSSVQGSSVVGDTGTSSRPGHFDLPSGAGPERQLCNVTGCVCTSQAAEVKVKCTGVRRVNLTSAVDERWDFPANTSIL